MGNATSCCQAPTPVEEEVKAHAEVVEPPDIRILAETVEPFSLQGKSFVALCTRVVDGDTMIIKFAPIDGHEHDFLMEERVRLAGIDCPETKLQDTTNLETLPAQLEEKKHGLACKKLVERLALNKLVLVEFGDRSKFGYPLVNIFTGLNGEEYDPRRPFQNLNRYLLDNTPTVPYDGKTKNKAFNYHKGNEEYLKCFATAFTPTP